MGKKVKNKDLAEKLGVSCTLVSLVLNNKGDQHGIKKETQERVLSLARQMGYFKSSEERQEPASPVEKMSGIIGMVIPSINDPFIYDVTPYLQKAFSSIGIGFTVILRDPDDQRFKRFVSSFRKFFSGLILVGEAADEKTIRALRDTDYPFMLLEKSTDKYRLNTVVTNTAAGIKLITDHVRNLGYKNILVICTRKSYSEKERQIKELNSSLTLLPGSSGKPAVEVIPDPVGEDDIDFQIIEKYFRPPLSAQLIITMNASLVNPLMSALGKRKIRIPQDVALLSFEDGSGFAFLHPAVTALRKPVAGLALKASNMIWSEVKNAGKGKYRRQVSLNPELVIRKSCGSV